MDKHIEVLEEMLSDWQAEVSAQRNLHYRERDHHFIGMRSHDIERLAAAIALMRGQSDDAPSIECYSYDGDQWFDSPDDIEFVAGRRAGDRFTLMVSHYSINRDYVVTKAPDKFGDDYGVEPAPPKDTADEQ